MQNIANYLWVGFISMIPVIELRGAIPVGAGLGLPWYGCLITAIIGNLLPVPFILLFIRVILKWMKSCKIKLFVKIALWLDGKVQKNAHKVEKYALLGLMLFVAIPLPGTGAWTGSLIAAVLNMEFKYSILSVAAGVVAAGLIMCAASYGFVSIFKVFT